ncbi:CLIP domain-containing serine protease B4-like [Uranotaenia lowii]|uniref:CLIP domain-containing serine protease B4-like n=1 Tax=Uranotaenia lowii TaxID=190385 RepID=UPI00247A0BC2|nr:CLIP domain-containing serine protease B4-like [Uranotaenia lowii]
MQRAVLWCSVVSVVLLVHFRCTDATGVLPSPGECGLYLSDRIYGGNITTVDAYTWTAILAFKEKGRSQDLYHCGGNLITNQYVLTAAHCLDDLDEDYNISYVRLGEWDLLSDKDCDRNSICNDPPVDVGIGKLIVHKGYNKHSLINDIALIKLKNPVEFTDFVSPICLPTAPKTKNKNTDKMVFTAVGWGNTEHKNSTYEYGSRYKLEVKLNGVNITYCKEVYDEDFLESQMCAGAEKGKDTCQGDSGGGLVAQVDGYYYEYGIVSWGRGCGQRDIPGVYTRVASYLDWIEDNIKNN